MISVYSGHPDEKIGEAASNQGWGMNVLLLYYRFW